MGSIGNRRQRGLPTGPFPICGWGCGPSPSHAALGVAAGSTCQALQAIHTGLQGRSWLRSPPPEALLSNNLSCPGTYQPGQVSCWKVGRVLSAGCPVGRQLPEVEGLAESAGYGNLMGHSPRMGCPVLHIWRSFPLGKCGGFGPGRPLGRILHLKETLVLRQHSAFWLSIGVGKGWCDSGTISAAGPGRCCLCVALKFGNTVRHEWYCFVESLCVNSVTPHWCRLPHSHLTKKASPFFYLVRGGSIFVKVL